MTLDETGMRSFNDEHGLILPFALLSAGTIVATGFLWWKYGERIFIERLIAGIAGCF